MLEFAFRRRTPRMSHLILSIAIVSLYLTQLTFSERVGIKNAPTFSLSDSFQFFFLSAPFPFNAPSEVVATAGAAYNQYGIAHGGIGIWDTTTNTKFSIELVADDYVGSLLPGFHPIDRTFQWNNTASIVVTNPIDESVWLYSSLVITTQGSAYKQLLDYLQDDSNTRKFSTYQPVTAIFANASLYNESTAQQSPFLTDDEAADEAEDNSDVLVTPTDAYFFANDVLTQLGQYGCRLRDFLPVYAGSFSYINGDAKPATIVKWDSGQSPPNDVYVWYEELVSCYSDVLNSTVYNAAAEIAGETLFISGVKLCYGSYAYIYRDSTSVYNVSLSRDVTYSALQTPVQSRYMYSLPPSNTNHNETLSYGDIAVLAIAMTVAVMGTCYFVVTKALKKKRRRRISFEMERLAARTVDGLVQQSQQQAGDSVDALAEQAREDIAYYHGSARKQSRIAGWGQRFSSRFPGGGGSGKGAATNGTVTETVSGPDTGGSLTTSLVAEP